MRILLTKAVLGMALAATTLVVAAPAEAQRRHYRDRDDDVAAGAIIGGIVGLGIGAAIASSNRDRYHDRRYYYRGPGYYPRRVYHRRYHRPYYRPYRAYPRCHVRRVYDPYIGRRVRVRYC